MNEKLLSLSNNMWLMPSDSSSEIIDQILINRKIKLEEKKIFLAKDFNDLEDPAKIKNLVKAEEVISKHFKNNSQIIIFGDYDADGIPASTLLESFLLKLGCKVGVVIPNRKDGYGLTKYSVGKVLELNPKLIITVDNGTNSPELIDEIIKKEIDVIVLDHHEISVLKLPKAIVINPKQKGDQSRAQILTAGGLVFKLIQFYLNTNFKDNLDWTVWLKWQLDLVAVSTVCDVVPLIGENRVLVDKGLIVLRHNQRECFKKLFSSNSLDPKKATTYTIGFIIGPRINATGRMGESDIGYQFLRSDKNNSDKYIELVNKLNFQRQQLFTKCLAEAKEILAQKKDGRAIILASPNWPEGIIGLIAAKLCEEYNKPTFIFYQNKNVLTGSARSIDGINLVTLLEDTKEFLIKYGGHEKAAGLSLDSNNLDQWSQQIQLKMNKFDNEIFIKKIKIDVRLKLSEISNKLMLELIQLEPYGMNNPQPIFFDTVKIESIKLMGKDQNHLKFSLSSNHKYIEAIAFSRLEWLDKLILGQEYAIVYQVDKSDWPGREFDIKIKDIAEHG